MICCLPSYLREDTLSQMLTMSNVQAHSNIIVMETTQGFLTGALLERMGGKQSAHCYFVSLCLL